ncbi:hypothetical protein PQQ53_13345 [Paraburkholderia strydomiana]|uniref:Lipoprotein n=1 Tax=Paraburkholderia strydomiana TaxID=1245417 RepID=A0ABW9ED30_9BURK
MHIKNPKPLTVNNESFDNIINTDWGLKLKTIRKALLASAALTALLAGCATNEQGQLVIDPNKVNDVIASALAPSPPAPMVVEEAYQPMPTDVYVANVVDHDVFISGGDTYIWVVGPNGARHRQFYAHGDHRADVFHRREELHRVMANHEGRLPDHPIGADHRMGGDHHIGESRQGGGHPQMGHPGEPAPAVAGRGQPTPGPMPVAHAVAPGKPAPAARPAPKDPKKS